MIRNQTRYDRDWYEILRTPAQTAPPAVLAETQEDAPSLAVLLEPLTPEDRLLEEVLGLEACATQYEDLEAGARAVGTLGRLKERIPVDLRAHAVTTCLFLAANRREDDARPALRERRDRAREALRCLRPIAPRELVWEIDELLATGKWNTSKRFPRAAAPAGGAMDA